MSCHVIILDCLCKLLNYREQQKQDEQKTTYVHGAMSRNYPVLYVVKYHE